MYQLAFQSKVKQLHDEGLLTQDDAFWIYRSVQDIYNAYRDSTLNGQQWGQGMDAYFSLMLRQSPRVADELRPLLLRFALWTLK